MKAIILAAGLGTRLLPFTHHTPKPLFTLNQRPILDLAIERLIVAGCRKIIINTHHLHERIEQFLSGQHYTIPVETRHEPEILGTGGAIRNVADFWENEPLLVFNADIVTDLDLAQLYDFHVANSCAVTMAMHDNEQFNTVWVDEKNHVVGFEGEKADCASHRRLAFTGIHVLDPVVLDYLPAEGPAHIITAYAQMLQNGQCIKARIVRNHYWQDIGTPERYHLTAFDHMAPSAFKEAFGESATEPIQRIQLKGDGSDRRWYRLHCGQNSLIMVDHHIRQEWETRQEVDAFVSIGAHLGKIGAAVPRIYEHDTFSGMVFLEDLGDTHLQQVVLQQKKEVIRRRYQQVIEHWLHMAVQGAKAFDPAWTYQSASYDTDLIVDKECLYFLEAFVNGYLGLKERSTDYLEEFRELANLAVKYGVTGFMHRDLQSRNIMIRHDRPWFIDFQGGRLGPLQYDLAALLIDPYVHLDNDLQDDLFRFACKAVSNCIAVDPRRFEKGYRYCQLTRNLQMLGAFGFLSRVKGKKQFEGYIPTAVHSLHGNLSIQKDLFPKLAVLVDELERTNIKERLP